MPMDKGVLQKTMDLLLILFCVIAACASLHLPLPVKEVECKCLRDTSECPLEVVELSMAAAYSRGIRHCMPGTRLCCSREDHDSPTHPIMADSNGNLIVKMPPNYKSRHHRRGPMRGQAEENNKSEKYGGSKPEIGITKESRQPSTGGVGAVSESVPATLLDEHTEPNLLLQPGIVTDSFANGEKLGARKSEHNLGSSPREEFADSELLESSELYISEDTTEVSTAPQGRNGDIIEHTKTEADHESDNIYMDSQRNKDLWEVDKGLEDTTRYFAKSENVVERPRVSEKSFGGTDQGAFDNQTLSHLTKNVINGETVERQEIFSEDSALSNNTSTPSPIHTTLSVKDTIEAPEVDLHALAITPSLLEEPVTPSPIAESPKDSASHPRETSSTEKPELAVFVDTKKNILRCSHAPCSSDDVDTTLPSDGSNLLQDTTKGIKNDPMGISRETDLGSNTITNSDTAEITLGATEPPPVTLRPVIHRTLPPIHLNSEDELKAFLQSIESLPKGGTSSDAMLNVKNRNQKIGYFSWLWG